MVMSVPGFGTVLRLPIFGAVTAAGVGVGVVLGLAAYRERRAMAVDATRAGYDVKNAAVNAWKQAKTYADGVKAEALAPRAGGSLSHGSLSREVEDLRKEVAALRAQLASSKK
jgi:hypothetical protein